MLKRQLIFSTSEQHFNFTKPAAMNAPSVFANCNFSKALAPELLQSPVTLLFKFMPLLQQNMGSSSSPRRSDC